MEEKEMLRNGTDQWILRLRDRFRGNATQTLAAFNSTRFTLEDAGHRRSPAAYLATLLRLGEDLGWPTSSILLQAYRGLDANLRAFVPEPTFATLKDRFGQSLDDMRDIWAELDVVKREMRKQSRDVAQAKTNYKGRAASTVVDKSRSQTRPRSSSGYNEFFDKDPKEKLSPVSRPDIRDKALPDIPPPRPSRPVPQISTQNSYQVSRKDVPDSQPKIQNYFQKKANANFIDTDSDD